MWFGNVYAIYSHKETISNANMNIIEFCGYTVENWIIDSFKWAFS